MITLYGKHYVSKILGYSNILIKHALFIILVKYFGFLIALIAFIIISKIYVFLVCLIFDLEDLQRMDQFFIKNNSKKNYTLGGIMHFKSNDKDKLVKTIQERLFLRFPKTLGSIYMFLGKYYFTTPRIKKLNFDEQLKLIKKRTIIIENIEKSKLEEFIQKELNTSVNIFEDIFKIFIIKYKNTASINSNINNINDDNDSIDISNDYNISIFIKTDHSFCDGLAFVSLIGHLDDNFDINKYPSIMKRSITWKQHILILIPDLIKILTFGIFEFIYYNNFNKKYYKGFNNKYSYNTVITSPLTYSLDKVKQTSKDLNISINTLCLNAIFIAFKNLSPSSEKISFMMPVGTKGIAKSVQDVELNNSANAAIATIDLNKVYKIFKDREFDKANKLLNIQVKSYIIKIITFITTYYKYFLNAVLLSDSIEFDYELCVSNIPGQTTKVKIANDELVNMYPVISIRFQKAFIAIMSYREIINFSIIRDDDESIDGNEIKSELKRCLDTICL